MGIERKTIKGHRLGRRAMKTDSRTLHLGNYLRTGTALPTPPLAMVWGKPVTQWGMMLNDRLGDCTMAGLAHAVQTWTANSGAGEDTLSDADVQRE